MFCAALAAAPCQETGGAEGLYFQGGMWLSAAINRQASPLMSGLKLGAGFGLPLGSGVLGLGLETGFGHTGFYAAIPLALSASWDRPVGSIFSLGAGLSLGGYFRSGRSTSPLLGGRLRAEIWPSQRLSGPGLAGSLYIMAGADLSPEWAGLTGAPVIETGSRLRFKK
jgi:hypothetical protein